MHGEKKVIFPSTRANGNRSETIKETVAWLNEQSSIRLFIFIPINYLDLCCLLALPLQIVAVQCFCSHSIFLYLVGLLNIAAFNFESNKEAHTHTQTNGNGKKQFSNFALNANCFLAYWLHAPRLQYSWIAFSICKEDRIDTFFLKESIDKYENVFVRFLGHLVTGH